MDFAGQHAIITGGSSGIGRALARLLSERGAHVSLIARRQSLLDETLAELESLRASSAQVFAARSADIASWEETESAIHSLVADGLAPDLLLNVAGFCHPGYVQDLSIEIFRDTMDVDYFGTVHATKAVIPMMMARHQGHIINFSSLAGFYAIFGFSPYCAAKFAVSGFSESLRQEMRPYGVHVSVVFPPTTKTPGLERENLYKPLEAQRIEGGIAPQSADQVARTVLRGIERRKRYILPGLDTKVFFVLAHLPPALTGAFHWFFIERIIAGVSRERQLR